MNIKQRNDDWKTFKQVVKMLANSSSTTTGRAYMEASGTTTVSRTGMSPEPFCLVTLEKNVTMMALAGPIYMAPSIAAINCLTR